jgi:N-methylhydantoinase A
LSAISKHKSLNAPAVLGVDIGGTFTDFVFVREGKLTVHKRLTTPSDPSEAMLAGIADLGVESTVDVVHGSTIATNALLERRGACVALITTRGFADVIEIGRQDRPDLYALEPKVLPPLVPPERRIEVEERVTAEGQPLIPLDQHSLPKLVRQLEMLNVESVAVCLLFSFLYPKHEKMIGEALRRRWAVSLSCEVLPEYREYERASTTVINAYVAPLMDRYLRRLEAGLQGRRLRIMQSNGGVITAATARREAARTALSGPAGGAVGAFHIAGLAGFDHIISFDMGGTSTDVALFPGEIVYTHEARIGGMPLRLPVVDVHTVGAGGGSIARVDAGGALQVGPESAGADPGPACYGRGDQPTISDANLVLGRLHPDHFLGGQMKLYPERAEEAVARLARQMGGKTLEEAAWGMVQVANATMERAIRTISIERGYDPRDFTLVAFGGAGPLHACALAEKLHIPRILVPQTPGVLSAVGMTIADLIKDYSQTVMLDQDVVLNSNTLDTIFAPLERQGIEDLVNEGVEATNIHLERILDMRYVGQSYEIAVPQPSHGNWLAAFHAMHGRRYGHQHEQEPVEIVNIRLRAVGRGMKPHFQRLPADGPNASGACIGEGLVWLSPDRQEVVPLYERGLLRAGNVLTGPAIVFQLDATTVIEPGWQAVVDQLGNLNITR